MGVTITITVTTLIRRPPPLSSPVFNTSSTTGVMAGAARWCISAGHPEDLVLQLCTLQGYQSQRTPVDKKCLAWPLTG